MELVVEAVLAAAAFAATFVVRFFVKRRCHASAGARLAIAVRAYLARGAAEEDVAGAHLAAGLFDGPPWIRPRDGLEKQLVARENDPRLIPV